MRRVLRIAAMQRRAARSRIGFAWAGRPVLAALFALAFGCTVGNDARPPKVVLLGLDGLTWAVLRPMIEAGRLPTFARLIESGASGVLSSEHPLISPAIWTTIATSRPREEHGIFHFYYKDALGAERLVDSTERRRSAIWNWLGAFDRTVGFIGWWASWPAERVNGWMVTDRMARSHWSIYPGGTARIGLTHPPALEAELRSFLIDPSDAPLDEIRELADFRESELAELRTLEKPIPFNGMSDLKFAYFAQRAYEEMALHLLERSQPDLTGIFLIANDPICHSFWHYYQPERFEGVEPGDAERLGSLIPRFQEHLDGFLARLLERLDDETVLLIVSDHGFQASPEKKWPSGDHHRDGVFIAAGGPVRAGVTLDATIYDIAPTILALLDLPIAGDLQGRVLTQIIEPAFSEAHPRKSIESFEPIYERQKRPNAPPPGDAEMRDLLRSLGYVE